jgi:hypothetical protein
MSGGVGGAGEIPASTRLCCDRYIAQLVFLQLSLLTAFEADAPVQPINLLKMQ